MIPAARTGIDRTKRRPVMATDQTNRGVRSGVIPAGRIFKAVVIKLREPRIDDTPAKWREKMAKSTDGPE